MFGHCRASRLVVLGALFAATVLFGQTNSSSQPTSSQQAASSQQISNEQQAPDASQTANAQKVPNLPAGCIGCELPVILRQNIVAGKTKVGSKVEARLAMATLLKGGVIPRDALLSGEVVESVGRTDSEPSRLGIRMDSAEWRNGGAKFKIYLTAWYYPPAPMAPPDLSYRPADAQNSNKNPGGTNYTEPRNPMSGQKWPPQAGDDKGMNAAAPASAVAKQRVLMKNVESMRNGDGQVVLVCAKSNIKLDKVTTYVLAAGELLPGK